VRAAGDKIVGEHLGAADDNQSGAFRLQGVLGLFLFGTKKGGRCFAKSSQLGPLRAFLPSESIGELPEKHHHDWLLPQKAAETMGCGCILVAG
jgi:hypothetical protein